MPETMPPPAAVLRPSPTCARSRSSLLGSGPSSTAFVPHGERDCPSGPMWVRWPPGAPARGWIALIPRSLPPCGTRRSRASCPAVQTVEDRTAGQPPIQRVSGGPPAFAEALGDMLPIRIPPGTIVPAS